jgi:hypothetical protein
MRFYSFADIKAVADCRVIASELYGCVVANGRCNAAWRGGTSPENVSIERDQWYDHGGEGKRGGGPIELAAFKFGGDLQQAQQFLGDRYNLTPKELTGAQPHRDGRYDALLRDGYKEVKRYGYHDLQGNLVHLVARLEHPEKPKEFCQGIPDGDGGIKWGLHGVETILYNLRGLASSDWAVIVEGEKKADLLIQHGIPATTCCGGAKKWRDDFAPAFAGKPTVILPDNDAPGAEHAQIIAESLRGYATAVKIVQTSPAPKGDVYDYLVHEGHTIEDLIALIQAVPVHRPAMQPIVATYTGPSDEELSAAKKANTTPFRNYVPFEKEVEKRGGKKGKEIAKEPRTHKSMMDDMNRRFLSFPRKVGDRALFDHDRDSGSILYMEDADALIAWIGRRSKAPPDWTSGDGMITQRQFLATVRAECRRYESISLIPSWPPRDDVYYAHQPLPNPCPAHSRFEALLDMFLPATPHDRCLLAAMICSPLWYIPGIPRPAWIIDSRDGQGSGKTTLVELIAQLYGHAPISTSRNELSMNIEVVKKRCVSKSGRDARIFLCDNVTGDFHSDELSSLITAKDITGMAPYGHGEETRPNDLVYCITSNNATVFKDISDRSLYIFVSKPPPSSGVTADSWKERAQNYVVAHRLEIVSDIIHMLAHHVPFGVPTSIRFREFEERILQPCCGSPETLAEVIAHVSNARTDSNIEADQARSIVDTFEYELNSLGLAGHPAFIRSDVANTWGRKALNEANSSEYKGRPVHLIRNLAISGFLPQVDREFKRIERDGKRERHSGIAWGVTDATERIFLVTKDGDGVIRYKPV